MDCPREWLACVQRAMAGSEDDGKAFCEEVGGKRRKRWTKICKETIYGANRTYKNQYVPLDAAFLLLINMQG